MYNMMKCPPLQNSEFSGSPDLSQVNSTTYTSEFPFQVPSTACVFSSSAAIERDSYINFSSRNVTLKNEKVFPSASTAKSLLYIIGAKEETSDLQLVMRKTMTARKHKDKKKGITQPNPMATRSNVCGSSLAGIVGSNPAGASRCQL
jgi:hypothetical protein